MSHSADAAEVNLLSEPFLGDQNDFTKVLNSKDEEEKLPLFVEKAWDQFIFEFFPYFLLSSLLIALTHFNESSFSDMIAVGYLIHAIYFVAHFRSFYTKNAGMLRNLRAYNLAVLTLYMLFQMPVFLCPGVPQDYPRTQGNYLYIPVDKCTNLLNYRDHDHNRESWHSFYFVVA